MLLSIIVLILVLCWLGLLIALIVNMRHTRRLETRFRVLSAIIVDTLERMAK